MKKEFIQAYVLFMFIAVSCVPYTPTSSSGSSNSIQFTDKIYSDSIKSIEFYPIGNIVNFKHLTPVIPLGEEIYLRLEFDDLAEAPVNYMVKIEKLKADWSPSYLNGMEYLREYNEFRINNYDHSLDTKVSYIHYSFNLPPVKNSGNYLLVVYPEGQEDQPIITRRFVVFENKLSVGIDESNLAFTTYGGHSVDIQVNYQGHNFEDPWMNMRAAVRQNNRWDNVISGIRPSRVKEEIKTARFQYFDETIQFQPGNEYRFFDLRSIIAPGQNVAEIYREEEPVSVNLAIDKSRRGLAYSFHRDLNGGFEIVNFDNRNSKYYADYVDVNFFLETTELNTGDVVYIFGKLTDWELSEENKMKMVTVGRYTGNLLLKQGWYDYQYAVKGEGKSINYLEDNHINTENYYEVFIYDTNPVNRHQYCVGYFQFGINERIR